MTLSGKLGFLRDQNMRYPSLSRERSLSPYEAANRSVLIEFQSQHETVRSFDCSHENLNKYLRVEVSSFSSASAAFSAKKNNF